MRTLTFLLVLLIGLAGAAQATPPTLNELASEPLRDAYRAGQPYTLRLEYKDKEGDRPTKAQFVDQSSSGKITLDAKVVGSDYVNGVVLEWDVTGFEQGQHNAYFLVKDSSGEENRYQKSRDPKAFYTFVAESLWLKIGFVLGGAVIGLVLVPFLLYVLARSLNKRGDPSTAARLGLLLGVMAVIALVIWQFAGFYNPPLVWGVSIIVGLAMLILIFSKR